MRRSAAPSSRLNSKRPCFLPQFTHSFSEIDKENEFLSSLKCPVSENLNGHETSQLICESVTSSVFEKKDDDVLRSTDEILALISEPLIEINDSKSGTDLTISECEVNISSRDKTSFKLAPKRSDPDESKFKIKTVENHEEKKFVSSELCGCRNMGDTLIFNVMWCKRSSKKHKIWEGDGLLIIQNRTAVLKNTDGKEIDKGIGYKLKEIESLSDGSKFYIGGKECEIQNKMSQEEYCKTGYCKYAQTELPVKCVVPKFKPSFKRFCSPLHKSGKFTQSDENGYEFVDENCFLLPRPPLEHQNIYNKEKLPVTDVQVDSFLAKQLRIHQKIGITFLYKCILGFQHEYGQGAILADEMGLGKTLQCIALIWTLFKKGPYGGKPLLKKIIIITPSSLVNNWENEFHKWLGKTRLSLFPVDKKNAVKDYVQSPRSVLIISYEMFRRSSELLSHVPFDLVICDEGHRIKNINIKISNVVNCLSTPRRILLTGTPIQNDLIEFFSIVDFVNPGALGSMQSFRRNFEKPIMLSRNQECTENEKTYGEEQSEELARLAGLFMLRRTQEVINQYLPPKSEAVVFCRPTDLQKKLYNHVLQSRAVIAILSASASIEPSAHLVYITVLRKLCNHPSLLYAQNNLEDCESNDGTGSGVFDYLKSVFPSNYHPTPTDSGKMIILEKILSSLLYEEYLAKEKVVIVSTFTKTLNIIENLCKVKGYQSLRLDGSTSCSSRQDIVDMFNRSYTKFSVFLLSSKAGGVGFNLIGASRIILYDIDWNPANDLQAMSRIWRDGQKHPVYVYRLLTTGTIEEKMYQRQLSKQCLSGTVLDPSIAGKLKFSQEELMDLFTFHEHTDCLTHDIINCHCLLSEHFQSEDNTGANSFINTSVTQSKNVNMAQLMKWEHICGPIYKENTSDFCLAQGGNDITFLFLNKVNSGNI